jgi:VIT1/CCC1 family predicted Fe2+/Mn2+ transporter
MQQPVNGARPAERRGLLDPIDRISEIIFGLIMAVTFVGAISVATAGTEDVRTAIGAALGCNLAWGLVDAVMYLVRMLTERTRNLALQKQLVGSEPAVAHRLIAESLPPHVAAMTGPEELEGMRRRLLDSSLPTRARLDRDDYVAAVGVFLLVVIATFPVVIPFILTSDVALAMNLSRVTTLAMLFLGGLALGRHAAHRRPLRTGLAMAALGAALIAAVKALGG